MPKTHEILVYGVIDPFWGIGSAWFAEQMAAAAEAEAEEIVVRINSAGGSVFEGIAMYNALVSSDIPTRAVVDSLAASAASIVLQGADVREMRRGTFVMVHNAAGLAMGDARDMRKMADDLDAIGSGLVDIYAHASGKKPDEIREIMDAETWYGPGEAVDAGFADEVLKTSRAKVAPRNQSVVLKAYRNLPEAVAIMAGIRAQGEETKPDAVPDTDTGAQPPSSDDDGEKNGETPPEPAVCYETPTVSEPAAPPAETPPDPDSAAPPAPAPAPAPTEPKVDEDTVSASYVREIVAVCTQARMADRIDAYLEARTSVDKVRAEILNAMCERQSDTHVDGRKPAKVAGGDPYGWAARLKAAGAFVN